MIPVALTIAGSDPSGGAGLQADLKTFHRHGVFGTAVVTLLTVQNTRGVREVSAAEPRLVAAQIDAVVEDLAPSAAKTGALGNAAVIEVVAERAARFAFPLVVDPVMISKHGAPLLADDAVEVLRERLLPHAALLTPNLPEARRLVGRDPDRGGEDEDALHELASAVLRLGPRAVLLKGGHRHGSALDLLLTPEGAQWFDSERVATHHTHGTGCVTAAAITAQLALGATLPQAVRAAKDFVTRAIRHAPGLGHGTGPIDLHQPPAELR